MTVNSSPSMDMDNTAIHDIDKLNDIVTVKMNKFLADAGNSKLSPEIEAVRSGKVVYQKRFTWIPIFWIITCGYLVFLQTNHPASVIVAFLIMFFWYDFFSGMLHIVLDNPAFITIPVLDAPCLEFQWHHHIPFDIASKSFLEVCGDLNVVVFILAVIYMGLFQIRNPVGLSLTSFKLFMAYFGQYCHRMAHTAVNQRPWIVMKFQDCGIMISADDHGGHHRTYDDNFCIGSGICNPLITWLLKSVTKNQWVWLTAFLLGAAFDVPVYNYILVHYAGFK